MWRLEVSLAKEVHDFEQVKEHHRKIAKNA
jgi:hypothetical protein